MKPGLQITYRGASSLDHVSSYIETKFARLRRKRTDIISCHVVVDNPHRSHRSGNEYRVSVDLSVPGSSIVGRSRNRGSEASSDIFGAVNEAFGALEHQLFNGKKGRSLTSGVQSMAAIFKDAVTLERMTVLAG